MISIERDLIIVADSSMQAICASSNSSFKTMIEGQFYMLLKPMKQDMNTFVPNEKMKPVKICGYPLQVKKADTNKLLSLIKANHSEKPAEGNNSLTSLKITLSKVIQGAYGPYQIAKMKDINKEKMDVNLYSNSVRKKVERGHIIEFKNMKVTEYKKEGQTNRRLVTTIRTTAEKINTETEDLFKDIPLGDEKAEGLVIAINDIFPYLSCSRCWRKTYEDDLFCQCSNNEDIHVKDFHCKLYIQIDDANIKVIHTFRRQIDININYQDLEEIQKALEDRYLERKNCFRVECCGWR